MAVVDAYASTPWYVDHIRPIMAALGEHAGRLYVAGEQAQLRGTNPILTVAYGDYATVRRLGRTRIILGQHGAGQSYLKDGLPMANPAYPGGRNQEAVGLFLVPNDTAAKWTRWRYPKARIEVVGCPKLETLPKRAEPGRVIAISTHWPGVVVPEAGSAWGHFKRHLLALSKRYEVLGHAHPRMLPKVDSYYRNAGIEIVPSFEEVCRRADVYICDNSSSMFEFAANGGTVVVMNAPQYRKHEIHGLRFWEASFVGINADTPEALSDAVSRALERCPGDLAIRDHALSLVYQPRTGSAALAAAAIRDWTG